MKKTFTIIITLLAVILLSVPTMAADTTTPSTIQPIMIDQSNIQALQGNVEQAANKTLTFIDTIDGNGWTLDYINGLESGDCVILIFNDNGTEDFEDDEIITIVKVI